MSSTKNITKKVEQADFRTDHHIGLRKFDNNCYLNCVIQVLFVCDNFCDDIIAYVNAHEDECDSNENGRFVKDLSVLMRCMKEKWYLATQEAAKEFSKYFLVNNGDDIQKCFQEIVHRVNKVIQKPSIIETQSDDKSEISFAKYKGRNYGFIFDLFYSQMNYKIECEHCHKIFNEHHQLLNVFPVPIPTTKPSVSLSECLDTFMIKSLVDTSDDVTHCCPRQLLWSISELTHLPKYILIYVVRGSYDPNDDKNRTMVELDRSFLVPTKYGPVMYTLKASVDHLGTNECGHYYSKCLHKEWLLINDEQVENISVEDIPSRNSVGFLMMKCDTKPIQLRSKYSYLSSVLQMLYSCKEFKITILNYLNCIKKKPSKMPNNDEWLIYDLAEIIRCLEVKDRDGGLAILREIEDNFNMQSDGNEIFTVFSHLLNIFKNPKHTTEAIEDLFCAKVLSKTKCQNCNTEKEQESDLRCVHVNLEKSDVTISLEDAVNKYFDPKPNNVLGGEKCCESPELINLLQIKKPSKYLLIHVKRGSPQLTFDDGICIGSGDIKELYHIRAVVSYDSGEYAVRCFHTEWWLFNKEGERETVIDPSQCPCAMAFMLVHSDAEKGDALNKILQNRNEITLQENSTPTNNQGQDALTPLGVYATFSSTYPPLVIQALFSCDKFRERIITYHRNSEISNFIQNKNDNSNAVDILFNNDICKLFSDMSEKKIPKQRLNMYNLKYSATIYECYESILFAISRITNENNQTKNSSSPTNLNTNNMFGNIGFIQDFFCVQQLLVRHCRNCSFHHTSTARQIFSIKLENNNDEGPFNLQKCIYSYFQDQKRKFNENKDLKCCNSPNIIESKAIDMAPSYILLYITHHYHTIWTKSSGNLDTLDTISIPSKNGNTLYKPKVIISNNHGSYSVKCFADQWNIISDNVAPVPSESTISNDIVALIIARQD